jgi:hypothetical protein
MNTLPASVGSPTPHPATTACIFVLAAATTLALFVLFASALIALPTGSPL